MFIYIAGHFKLCIHFNITFVKYLILCACLLKTYTNCADFWMFLSESWQRIFIFFLSITSKLILGPTQPPSQWVPGFFPVGKGDGA